MSCTRQEVARGLQFKSLKLKGKGKDKGKDDAVLHSKNVAARSNCRGVCVLG
jgi:hypothetical protein